MLFLLLQWCLSFLGQTYTIDAINCERRIFKKITCFEISVPLGICLSAPSPGMCLPLTLIIKLSSKHSNQPTKIRASFFESGKMKQNIRPFGSAEIFSCFLFSL